MEKELKKALDWWESLDHVEKTYVEDRFGFNYRGSDEPTFNSVVLHFYTEINKAKKSKLMFHPYTAAANPSTKAENPTFSIGIDLAKPNTKDDFSYSLFRHHDKTTEIVLCKSMVDEVEFKEEVANLAKYFNAKIVE